MNTMKRLLAVVLTLCMFCALLVPAAFAERIDITITSGAHTGSNLPFGTVLNNGATTGVGMKYLGFDGTRFNPTTYVTVTANGSLIVPLKRTGTNYDVCSGWVALELTNVTAGNYTLAWWSIHNSANSKANEKGEYAIYAVPSFDYSGMDDAAFVAAINALTLDSTNKVQTVDFSTTQSDISENKVVNFAADGNYIIIAKFVGIGSGNGHSSRSYFSASHLYLDTSDAAADITVGEAGVPDTSETTEPESSETTEPESSETTEPESSETTEPESSETTEPSEPVESLAGPTTKYLSTNLSADLEVVAKDHLGEASATQQWYYLGSYGQFWGKAVPTVVNKNATDDLNVPHHLDASGSGWVAMEITGVTKGNYTLGFWSSGGNSDKLGGGLYDVYVIESFDYSKMDDVAIQNKIAKELKSAKKVFTYDFSTNTTDSQVVRFVSDGDYILIAKLVGKGSANTHTSGRTYFRTRGVWLTGAEEVATVTVGTVKAGANDVLGVTSASGVTTFYESDKAADAINAAIEGQTLTLYKDFTSAADITLAAGVTLDLNGKKLTAPNAAFAGAVIDTVGGGKVAAVAIFTGSNGGYLPLSVGEGEYGLFKVTVASLSIVDVTEDTAGYWFRVTFAKAAAYDYVADLSIAASFAWVDAEATEATNGVATASEDLIARWAAAAKAEPKTAIKLTVKGLSGVEGFALTPVVSANGVIISADAMTQS